MLERTLDAPLDLVWKACTDPEHLKRWFSPRPYEITEIELDLRPGGIFRIRMIGPDGFDTGHGTPAACSRWSTARSWSGPARSAPDSGPTRWATGCDSFPMTAIVTLADAGNGKTLYRAVALHKDAADRDTHEKMGFHDGWGTTASQLEELAQSLAANA